MTVIARTYAANLAAFVPLLALLLVPQLMRSRAGSENLLMIGALAYITLLVCVVVAAPYVSALAAPKGTWRPNKVKALMKQLRRNKRRAFWLSITGFVGIVVLSQLVGLAIAELAPYISENPAYVEGGSAKFWIIHYQNYVLQALGIYLVICAGTTWHGLRMRKIALAS